MPGSADGWEEAGTWGITPGLHSRSTFGGEGRLSGAVARLSVNALERRCGFPHTPALLRGNRPYQLYLTPTDPSGRVWHPALGPWPWPAPQWAPPGQPHRMLTLAAGTGQGWGQSGKPHRLTAKLGSRNELPRVGLGSKSDPVVVSTEQVV